MVMLESEVWKILESISISLTFIVSCLTLIVIYREYKKHKEDFHRKVKIEQLDLYLKLKSEVLSQNSKLLMFSILEKNIHIVDNENGLKVLVRHNKGGTSTILEIDLLQRIDDIYYFYEQGLLTLEDINQGYSSTIIRLWSNQVIKNFVSYVRERENDQEIFAGIRKLFNIVSIKTSI